MLVASTATSMGVDWPGDFMMGSDGRLKKRLPHQVAPFVYTGVGIMKPDAFRAGPEGAFRLAPLLFDWAEQGRLFGVRLDGLVAARRPAGIGGRSRTRNGAFRALTAAAYFGYGILRPASLKRRKTSKFSSLRTRSASITSST